MSDVGRTGYNPITHPSFVPADAKHKTARRVGNWAATIAANILTLGGAYIVSRGLQYKKIYKAGEGEAKFLSKEFIKFLFSKPGVQNTYLLQVEQHSPFQEVKASTNINIEKSKEYSELEDSLQQLDHFVNRGYKLDLEIDSLQKKLKSEKNPTEKQKLQTQKYQLNVERKQALAIEQQLKKEAIEKMDNYIQTRKDNNLPIPEDLESKLNDCKTSNKGSMDFVTSLKEIMQQLDRIRAEEESPILASSPQEDLSAKAMTETRPASDRQRTETNFTSIESEPQISEPEIASQEPPPEPKVSAAKPSTTLPIPNKQFNLDFARLKETNDESKKPEHRDRKTSFDRQLKREQQDVIKQLQNLEGWIKLENTQANFKIDELLKLGIDDFIAAVDQLKKTYNF